MLVTGTSWGKLWQEAYAAIPTGTGCTDGPFDDADNIPGGGTGWMTVEVTVVDADEAQPQDKEQKNLLFASCAEVTINYW